MQLCCMLYLQAELMGIYLLALKMGFIVSSFTEGKDLPTAQQPVGQVSYPTAATPCSVLRGQVQ